MLFWKRISEDKWHSLFLLGWISLISLKHQYLKAPARTTKVVWRHTFFICLQSSDGRDIAALCWLSVASTSVLIIPDIADWRKRTFWKIFSCFECKEEVVASNNVCVPKNWTAHILFLKYLVTYGDIGRFQWLFCIGKFFHAFLCCLSVRASSVVFLG